MSEWEQHLTQDWYAGLFDEFLEKHPVTVNTFVRCVKASIDINVQMKSFIDHGLLKLRNVQDGSK